MELFRRIQGAILYLDYRRVNGWFWWTCRDHWRWRKQEIARYGFHIHPRKALTAEQAAHIRKVDRTQPMTTSEFLRSLGGDS